MDTRAGRRGEGQSYNTADDSLTHLQYLRGDPSKTLSLKVAVAVCHDCRHPAEAQNEKSDVYNFPQHLTSFLPTAETY